MTSTNDGSNLKSGKKDKRYYIESFQSLEARLNGQASTEQRTRNVCEAWRLVHGLCSHSTPDTRSHLLSWIQRNTAYAILQDEWGLPENKTHHVELEKGINDFILECHETDTLLVWETTLLRRAVWYKGVLSNPWGHSVLKALLDPKSTQPTDQEVIQWLREERAMMFVTRVRVMARAKRLIDLALVLVSAVMTRARAPAHSDVAPGVPGGSKSPNFVETLSREAGFTKDVWELLMDIEFVLLHKQDQTTCIDLAKKIPLKDGKRIVERLRFRLDKSPADKKLWKKAKDVAILIAQVVITRCMVMTSCSGAVLDALTGCASALALLLDGSRLPQAAAALAAPAATAAHLYAFANAIAHQCKDKIDRQPFVCELYVRAITAGMNELERLKLEKDKEPEVCALQHTLSGWFSHLGEVLSSSARLRCECLLTAFSLHPSATMYERVAALPPIAAPDKSPKRETTEVTSEFGSWATDSRTSSNFVKTSETLNLKQTQRQTNILSSSMFDTECGALGLKTELCEDLAVLLSGPRVKTLSWDMDRETLLENCRVYMERTQEGTRALTTELKYLNLDPKSYDHLPEEEDDEDNYYGIEKGYEIELEYEDIWSDNNIEYAEGCESACSISTVDSTKNSTKPKGRKNPAKYSEDESDPLSLDAEPNFVQSTTENKKKTVKKQNDVTKKKSKPKNVNDPESKKLSESDQEKELLKKQKRKERRDRKKREKMEMLLKQELQIGRDDNTSNPTGTNIVSAGVEPVKERRKQKTTGRTQHVSATDSDYDSQGKSSLASINSEGNDTDVLFGGLFSMDGVGSLEKTTSNNANSIHDTNSHRNIIMKQTDTQDNVKDKLKNYLQFRQQSNQVEKAHSASKINIVWREGVQSQIQDASPRSIICKNTEPENLDSNLKRSEKNIRMDASKRNVPANNAPKKTYVAPSRKKIQARAQAVKPGLLISDPHQLQFQEFLKRHNIPITNNANKQHPPTTTKEPQSQLAQRNPVLSGLIQQRPELHQHVNSIKDINKEPSNRLVNSEVQKLQQQNLSIVENKKNLPQKCGVDNAPNTFSRLSYMHKNKQADMKYKQLNEQIKTPISKIIDNDSLVKIKNLQAKGEICISKALKRNTIAISRENPPPLIKQGERIPNPLTTAAVQPTDLRVNIVNVSKATKEIFENKVIIKKQQKATTPVDLQYLIHERNLDVGSNWKSQYPNTVIEKSTDNAPMNVGNASNEDKVVVLGVESDEPINNIAIAHENKTKVVVSHSAQYNNKGDIKVTPNIGAQLENSEDWKHVMNKLISLKSEKKGVDALEMALNRNSSIKANVEIFRHLPKNTANSKSIHYQEHNKMSSKQKGRTSVVDTKPNLTKNAIVIKTDQPNIKKVVKKSIPKYIDPTKSLANTNTLKTNNVIMPSMHNSDYDQLDDLIDDELRQEIEESSPLTSEVDIVYGPARVTTATSDKEKLAQNKSSQEIKSVHTSFANYNMEQSTRQSSIESASNPVTRTCSVIKENSQGPSVKPKLHIISDQILPPYTKSSGSKTEKYSTESNESRSSVVAMRPLSHSQKISCGVHNNNISVITSPINIVHPANVIIRNVSNTNQVQNLMLITPTNIIPAFTHRAPIVEQPQVLNVTNQTEYVLNTQNTSLFSSPETVQVGNPSMASERTDLPKPNHQQCRSDLLKSNDSKKHDHANAITEVISQSNLESHANIGANRLKGEELIKSHSINQNVAQHRDESLKINLEEGHALPFSMNRIKDSNINKMNLPFLENQFQHTDETSNTIMSNKTEYINSNTEKKSHLKSEVHQNLADPKSVSNQIIYKKSKCEDISSKCDKRDEIQSNVIEFNLEIYNKEKVRSPSILSENYDQIMDTEFSTDMKDEVAKTGTLQYKNTKEGSPSILNDSFDRIVNTRLTTDTKGELDKTETDENKKIARSPSILNGSSNQIMNTEFTTDMEGEIYKSKTNNSEEEKGRSLFLLSDSCKQIIDQNFTTTVKKRSDTRQSYKDAFKNAFEDCFEKSLDISSKTDKQTKLKQVICDPQEVNILNEATVSDLNVVTNKTFENENYLVTEMPKSYDPNLPQNLHEPIMTLSVYIPQKKTVDSATIDTMSTKFCERKVLSQVQEYELSKASEIIENKKSLNNKHPQDYKNRSDIERLRRKRLSIIHREINHYIPSEPIALMYAPIQFEIRSNNDEITQPKTSSQNNLISKTEERLKSDNESNAKVSVTNSEVVQLNSERCIKKSDNIPSRRLRSSNLFRTKERTTLDDSNINLPNSELQTNANNVSEAKKTASKRILESSLSSNSFVTREKNNELLDNTHNIDANKKLKENTDRLEHVTANSKSVNNVADTIDLTDTEPIKELNLSVCGLLNSGPVTTSIPKIRQQVHTLFKDIRKKSLKKEVTVTDIKELPSPNGDVMRKILRIKLSNGNIFRATVSGNLKVDIRTILSEPSIKSILTTNVLNSKSCTVNVKHVIDSNNVPNKNILISSVVKRSNAVSTEVIELSDDEDENIYYFKTEFGTYKTKSIDSKAYEKHQNKFLEKCTVKIPKIDKNMTLNGLTESSQNIVLQNENVSITKISDVTNSCENSNYKIIDSSEKITEESEINSETPSLKPENILANLKDLESTLLKSQIVQLHNDCRVNLARCDQEMKLRDCGFNSANPFDEPKGSGDTLLSEENVPDKTSNSFSLSSDTQIKDEKHGDILRSFDLISCNSDWISGTKPTIHSFELLQQKYLKSMYDVQTECNNLKMSSSSDALSNLSDTDCNDKSALRPDSPSIIADFESKAGHNSYTFVQSFCNSDWMLYTKATIHSLEVRHQKYTKAEPISQVNSDINLDSSTDCDSDLELDGVRQEIEELKISFQVPSLFNLVYTLITSNVDVLERYLTQNDKNFDIFNSPTHNLKRKLNTSDTRNNSKIFKIDSNVFEKQDIRKSKHTTIILDHPKFVDEAATQHYVLEATARHVNVKDTSADHAESVDKILSLPKILWHGDSSNNDNNDTCEKNDSILKVRVTKENNLPNNIILEETQTYPIKSNCNKIQLIHNDQETKNSMKDLEKKLTPLQEFQKIIILDNKINVSNDRFNEAQSNNIMSVSKALCAAEPSKNDSSDKCEENESNLETLVYKKENVTTIQTSINSQTLNIKNDSNHTQFECNDQESNSAMKYIESNKKAYITNSVNMFESDSNVAENADKNKDMNKEININNAVDHICATEVDFEIEKNESNEHTNPKVFEILNQGMSNSMPLMDSKNDDEIKLEYNQHIVQEVVTNANVNNAVDRIRATEVDFEIEKNESNEDTNPKVFEILNQGMSNSMPLMDSKKDDEIKLEYNQHILQGVVTNANVNNAVDRIRATEVDFEIEKNESNEDTNPKVFEILNQGRSNSMPLMDSKKDDEVKLEYNQHILQEVVTNANVNNAVDRIRATEVDFEIEKNESNEDTNPKVFEILNQGMSNFMPLMDSKNDDEIKLEYNQHIIQEVVTNANVNNAVDRIRATEVDFEIEKNESNEDTNPKVFEILNQGMSNSMPLTDSKKDDEIKLEYNQHILQEVVTNANVNNAVDRIRATEVDFEIEKNESNEDTNPKVFEILNQGMSNSMPLMDSKKDDEIKLEYNQHILQEVVTNANVNNAVDRIRATEVDFEIEKNESNEDTNLKVFEILNQGMPNSMPLMDSKKDDEIKLENNQYILHKVVTNANDFSEKLVQGSEKNGKNIDNGSTNDTIINETSENEDASVGNNTIKLDDEENLFCATEDTLNYKKQKFSEESLVTTDVELSSKKLPKSSKFENVTTFETTQACPIESKTIKIDTNIGHKIDLSKAPEDDNILNEDQSQLKSLEINNSQVNIIEDLQECKTSFRIQNLSPNKSNEVVNGNVTLNSTELSVTPSFSLECEQNNQENQFQKINKDENTSSISENVIENIRDDKTKVEKNKRQKNENDSVTLIYNGNSNVVLKGSPYVDPVVGTCYIFPLSSSSCNRKELTSLNANQTINMIKALKKKSINESDDTKDKSNLSLILPEITYSRPESNNANVRQLKRKSDTKNDCKLQKKYRKGKNIDACKQTSQIYAKIAYTSQYKRLLEYCTTIKFSYSRPFHKNSIDPGRLLKNWPIQDRNCDDDSTVPPLEECEKLIYHDINKENKAYFDPLQQTLAEEIAVEYNNEKECPQFDETEDSNFNMGFGEGSDRVIQNLANGIFYTSKFSAATLSDVKLPQPYFTTRDKIQYVPQIIKKTNDEELAIMKRCISFIQLREKVKDFFKRSACELHCNWNVTKRSSKKILYELTSPQFLDPPTHEVVVNVVQVGQLPVSASAQNPVTCDPRVTHVSNASPPQCSAENSPDSDQNTSKTEYTELTTADLSLPMVQEYQRSSQVIMSSQSQLSVPEASKVSIDTNCENKEVEAKNDNTEESDNFLPDHKSISNISYTYNPENDSFKSGNNSYRSVNESYKSDNDSYKSDSNHKPEKNLCKPDNNALLSENSRTLDAESQNAIFDSLLKEDNNDYVSTPKTTNGTSEKTDQIAHAMNAAGITTGSDSINNNSRAHALVNILSQKIRQNTGNTTQTSVNSYNKGSPINAMALQQALAQILPPPLNQTNSSDNQSTLTPQVLHIVQGKNTSGNQITIVDNQPNSVINNSNNTPVLHIVQNKSSIGGSSSNSNSATQNNNSFSGLSLVDAGIQQGGNQLLHIVNTGGQKNSTSGQLLKRVNLLTNLTNVQGNNEQKMVQFVCKSADGKSIQLNAPHQRSMVLRLQPIEPTNVSNAAKPEGQDNINQSPNFVPCKENNNTQQEIKSRSVYEENYAKFIQNSSPKSTMPEKSTSLPKFNQAFGKQVFQDNNQKSNEMQSNSSSHEASTNSSTENIECSSNDNAINLEHINQINSPPLLLRKSPAQTSQSQQGQNNLVQQIKQTIAPVNIQTMHGGVIYTRQIPVNIGGGQTINLITVPSTELMDESGQKQQGEVKFVNQNEIEQSIIKIVPQSQNSSTSESTSEDNNALNASNDAPHTSSATHTQPVLTQMRIKLPMLSKTPQMVSGARLVRPSFFQIQRNVIGGANQPVYQQLVLTAAPSLGQQSVRPPQAQPVRVKTTTENQTSSESQMSSSTLEQLREFDMVLEQVKERSTVQPNSNTNTSYTKLQSPTETTESNTPASAVTTEPTQQVLYSIGNNNSLNVAYVNRKPAATTPTTSTFARSPDSSGVADSPTSSTHIQIPAQSSSNETSSDTSPQQSQPKPKSSSKSKSRPKTSTNPTTSMKINTVPPKTSTQKPLEDEQTTQRILYILAEYKEQVENSPDKDKPAPRRRSNPPSNPGSSKRKKSSSGSRRPGGRDMSPIHGEDTCRTMGSEDSSCGTSQGDCTENCLESHSPQDSPRKVVRKLTFENETSNATPRQQPARNVIVADGQTITVARGTAGKPATAVLMPANYILPVSMVKGGQQIAIVTNRGPKILTVGGEGGGNALLLQRLIGPAGLKPVLARPGVRHVRLPTAALHNLQAFNIATATSVQPPDSTASPAPAPTPPDLGETRATGSPWPDRDSQDVKPERSSSPEGSEPWNLPSSADPHDYSYEETVRAENLDRTVLDAIPDRYSPDLEAQRIFDKMFDVDTKKSYIDSQDDSPRCGYDIETSDCDDKGYQQVVQKRDQRQHRLAHVSAAALRHKYAILEHELRLQKSLSEECEDLGVDSPSAAELFPEAELLFASSPAHESSHRGHTPQPGISQTIPQPDIDDQIATDQLLNRSLQDEQLDVTLGLDEGIVTVSEDGMQATITLDQEEFARSHPNTTFHSEPTEEENVQPYTISGIKGRHITSTIFHAGRAPATVLMTAPQTTVISQAADTNIKYIDNIINPTHNVCLSSVLVKDDGLTKYDNILNDSRELHLSNTASAIVHSNATQVIRRVCYDEDKNSRFLLDETDALIAGDDAKMIAEDSSRDATLESIADDRSSPERHTELFWESNSASERSDSRRPLDFSSDSDKCCKSPLYDETNSTDSSGVGTHMRLDSVIKDARGLDRSSADNSSADDTIPPLRTYPPKRMYHVDSEMERSVSGKTRAGERSPDGHEVRRRASVRGVVKRGCHCCNGSPAPPRPKKSRQKKPSIDFNN